jgi:hypothetical protein
MRCHRINVSGHDCKSIPPVEKTAELGKGNRMESVAREALPFAQHRGQVVYGGTDSQRQEQPRTESTKKEPRDVSENRDFASSKR